MELDVDSIGEELLALWKSEGLRRCSARALDGIAIPDSSKRLLSEFGLPARWGLDYLADEDQLPRLNENHPDCFVLGSRRVASRPPHYVYLDVQKGGSVFFRSSYGYEDLMNTSVERFAAYLVLHRRLLARGRGWRSK